MRKNERERDFKNKESYSLEFQNKMVIIVWNIFRNLDKRYNERYIFFSFKSNNQYLQLFPNFAAISHTCNKLELLIRLEIKDT